ncbi:ATP-binding protein [Nitrincola sp. MINF-07-Sa-05]|uniref:ATP-binding protein n=1 Tax=Nitrincola salilacus TaxID=3400273 RepID=UPI003917F702
MDLKISDNHTKPMVRVFIMLIGLLCALLISWKFTGSPLPQDSKYALIFQNALLLIVLGSAILEHFFTKPADSMINSLMAGITMFGVYHVSPALAWWVVFSYCLFVFLISSVCVATSGGRVSGDIASVVNSRLYRPAIVLGRSRLIFSIVFLFGVYSFYSIQSEISVYLIVFWGVFMAIWPLKLPQLLSSISFNSQETVFPIGKLLRMDNPGVLRFAINQNTDWEKGRPLIYQRVDKSQQWVLPLYSHLNDERRIGTAMLLGAVEKIKTGLTDGHIYEFEEELDNDAVMSLLGETTQSRLIGFVAEDSSIGRIRLEVKADSPCADGMLIWCKVGGVKIYYQISAGTTIEENLDGDKHGYQIAYAAQLGTLENGEFKKFDWLPNMNAPVFSLIDDTVDIIGEAPNPNDFKFGNLPKSNIPVLGDFVGNFNFHTAVLGVTGSGKTEFAFDLIRHSVSSGIKVICIDLTSQYKDRLADLTPTDLSIQEQTSIELSQKLFDVETGTYGAPNEKKALQAFSNKLRTDVDTELRTFMANDESRLGLIQLPEISNSQASIFITEIYMSCLLNIAKESFGDDSKRVLVAVEEAHTIMPESATMGVSDFASKGLVAKIAQIALQGRKYNVGLLVLAQRTANVSKTVLTQCNSIVSFACYDDTSISFLKNMFGSSCAEMVPNLKKLQAVVFGKIVKSERPVVVEIPYDQNKV